MLFRAEMPQEENMAFPVLCFTKESQEMSYYTRTVMFEGFHAHRESSIESKSELMKEENREYYIITNKKSNCGQTFIKALVRFKQIPIAKAVGISVVLTFGFTSK